jgi:hypothetical protein
VAPTSPQVEDFTEILVKRNSARSATLSERAVESWAKLPVVQPVNTGTTGSDDPVVDDPVVVVVDGGTGPVNESTNVSSGYPTNPAATHQDVNTHATDGSRDPSPTEGGFATIDHELPSHAWTSISRIKEGARKPTATHDSEDVHDTASSTLIPGSGLAMIVHELPFHDSTKVVFPALVWPTAMHHDKETHDTPCNWSLDALAFGLATTDHELPFHDTTKVSFAETPWDQPTAVQNEVDTHDTARR